MGNVLNKFFKKFKFWFKHGLSNDFVTYKKGELLHKSNGPAVITYDCSAWYRDGVRHRFYGPAYNWDVETNRRFERWYISNKVIKAEWVDISIDL